MVEAVTYALQELGERMRGDAVEILKDLIYSPTETQKEDLKEFVKNLESDKGNLRTSQIAIPTSPINILKDYLGLWLWRYENHADLLWHWHIEYPQLGRAIEHRKKLISNALEKVKIRGGRSSVGVATWTNSPVILGNTAADPRSGASLIDYMLRDLSWVGIPISDGVHVRVVMSFFLPYENAWKDEDEIVRRLRSLNKKYSDELLLHEQRSVIENMTSALAKTASGVKATSGSLLKTTRDSRAVDSPYMLILERNVLEEDSEREELPGGYEMSLPSPSCIQIDGEDTAAILLQELNWCSFALAEKCNECGVLPGIDRKLCNKNKKCGLLTRLLDYDSDGGESDTNKMIDILVKEEDGQTVARLYFKSSRRLCSMLDGSQGESLRQALRESLARLRYLLDVGAKDDKQMDYAEDKRLEEYRASLYNIWASMVMGGGHDEVGKKSNQSTNEQRERYEDFKKVLGRIPANRLDEIEVLAEIRDKFLEMGGDNPGHKKSKPDGSDIISIEEYLDKARKASDTGSERYDPLRDLVAIEVWEKRSIRCDMRLSDDCNPELLKCCPDELEKKGSHLPASTEVAFYTKHPGTLFLIRRIGDLLATRGKEEAEKVIREYSPLISGMMNAEIYVREEPRKKWIVEISGSGIKCSFNISRKEESNYYTPITFLINEEMFREELYDALKTVGSIKIPTSHEKASEHDNRIQSIVRIDRRLSEELNSKELSQELGGKIAEEIIEGMIRLRPRWTIKKGVTIAPIGPFMMFIYGFVPDSGDLSRLQSYLGEAYEGYRARLRELTHARCSEVAGIMARNMSHNIGSHVLAASDLTNQDKDVLRVFHTFLQQRMDFISQVVTYSPSAPEPIFFYNDLLGGFLKQEALIKFLIKDQGYDESKIVFIVIHENKEIKFEHRVHDFSKSDDFLVGVPAGMIGAHAFYDIIENMMRNSAIYNKKKNKFEVYIKMEDSGDNYKVILWNNTNIVEHSPTDLGCECAYCNVSEHMKCELIDPETFESMVEGRGVYEMRICASLLAGKTLRGKGGRWTGDDLRLELVEDKDKNTYLGFAFKLQKPRLLNVIGKLGEEIAKKGDPRSVGIRLVGPWSSEAIRFAARCPAQILLLDMAGLEVEEAKCWLRKVAEEEMGLPFRVIALYDGEEKGSILVDLIEQMQELPRRRIKLLEREEFNKFVLEDTSGGRDQENRLERILVDVYKTWLRLFSSKKRINVLIAFSRDNSEDVKRWVGKVQGKRSDSVGGKTEAFEIECKVVSKETIEEEGRLTPEARKIFSEIRDNPEHWIIYDNHRLFSKQLNKYLCEENNSEKEYDAVKLIIEKTAFYQVVEKGKNLSLYQMLTSPPTSSLGFEIFLTMLIETSLAKLVIVDERIAEHLVQDYLDKKDEEKREDPIGYHWSLAQIYPICNVEFDRDSSKSRVSIVPGEVNIIISRNEGLIFKKKNDDVVVELKACTLGRLEEEPFDLGTSADVLVIHQSLINRFVNNKLWQAENDKDMKHIYRKASRIIVTSGRGRTLRHVSSHTPFIEFSYIQSNLQQNVSKYHLMRAIFSITGE